MKRQKILDFYKIFIEGYIKEDVEVLSTIKPDPKNGLRGCSIPTAMTVISSMDLLGLLLNEKGKANDSRANITFFIQYKDFRFFPGYGDSEIEKIFNYRHGMMHHFFPKFKGFFAGICKDDSSPNLFVYNAIDGKQEESLNVSILSRDFLRAIENLKYFLQNEADDSIYETILNHLKDFDYYLDIAPQMTICTTINPGTPKN